MSRTFRWWNNKRKVKKLPKKRKQNIHPWKSINPYYFRHELKFIRVKIHRAVRRGNRIRLKKGLDIEKEQKTNRWMTH